MRRLMLRSSSAALLAFAVLFVTPEYSRAQSAAAAAAQDRAFVRRPLARGIRNRALQFARSELFFGTAKPAGVVTEADFMGFLDHEITPRFPDGLTVFKAEGQFRGEDDVIIKEDSYVLILLYPIESFRESEKKIEEIRRLYMAAFEQESVLRVDDPFLVWVRF